MLPFLQLVADDLIEKYGTDLSRLVLVFPNKRARLFVNNYLAMHGTVWAPRYTSIAELFQSFSDVGLNDPIDTVCRIHHIYKKLSGSEETLDTFYGWGEKLLSDFDDTDKNLVDAERLFSNVKDYKSIDFGDYLNESEKDVIRSFFLEFDSKDHSQIKENFLKIWTYMYPIYSELNSELLTEGLAYEGALYRRSLQRLTTGEALLPEREETEKWIFVGFNVLDKVEHDLMSFLKDEGRAAFYWDYDVFYVNDDARYEAGDFLRQNLLDFPNELPQTAFCNMGAHQNIEFVAAPSENAQAFQTTDWIRQHLTEDEKRTAIVLCNEDMLEPLLHVIPQEVNSLNITKGFPMGHTTAFSELLRQLDDVGKECENSSLTDYLSLLLDRIKLYAQEQAYIPEDDSTRDRHKEAVFVQLQTEACYRIYTLLERLYNLSTTDHFVMEISTLRRLIIQLARQTNIPFHGEPAVGLQVMGMLETRNLDFENVLILSANEGTMPPTVSDNSFVPYPLKAAYGLTLASKKTAVFAYYFFRLIQRAKNIRIVYNCTADGLQKGEKSRYMTQLMLSQQFNIRHLTLSDKICIASPRVLRVEKPENIFELLTTRKDADNAVQQRDLSPSALNAYLDCPLKFFFSYVAKIKKPQDPDDSEDNRLFGNIFHKAAEMFYKDALQRGVDNFKVWIGGILSDSTNQILRSYIQKAYMEEKAPRSIIAEETLLSYLKKLLQADAELGNLRIIDLEKRMSLPIKVKIGGEQKTITIGGIIDRLDVATNPNEPDPSSARTLRVVDYKTGNEAQTASGMSDIFYKKNKRPYYFLQTFLYALIVKDKVKELSGEELPTSMVLFYPSLYQKEGYSPWIKMGKFPLHALTDELAAEYKEHLVKTIEEIFNPEIPFEPVDNEYICRKCDFKLICGKREKK